MLTHVITGFRQPANAGQSIDCFDSFSEGLAEARAMASLGLVSSHYIVAGMRPDWSARVAFCFVRAVDNHEVSERCAGAVR